MPGHRPAPIEVGVQAHIGNLLRAMYDSALKEPVPDRFIDLLKQMDSPAAASEPTPPPVTPPHEALKLPEGGK
jgi:hypothetical protein